MVVIHQDRFSVNGKLMISEFLAFRNFWVGDRVKVEYKGRWYSGSVSERFIVKHKAFFVEVPDFTEAYVRVKTDERIDGGDTQDLFGGYGLEVEMGSEVVRFIDEDNYPEKYSVFNRFTREATS